MISWTTDSIRQSSTLKADVAHRPIGQEPLGFAASARLTSSLDGLAGMLNWS